MSVSSWGIDHGSDISKSVKGEFQHYNRTANPNQKGISAGEKKSRKAKNRRVQASALKGYAAGTGAGAGVGAAGGLAASALSRGRIKLKSGAGWGAVGGTAIGANAGVHAGKKKGIEREYPGTTLGAWS